MKSWMTFITGAASVVIALYHCYEMGKIDVMCVVGVINGGGLMLAKDFNVTGGTRAQDDKAGGFPAKGAAPIGSNPDLVEKEMKK